MTMTMCVYVAAKQPHAPGQKNVSQFVIRHYYDVLSIAVCSNVLSLLHVRAPFLCSRLA
jgi:hypothetical protein